MKARRDTPGSLSPAACPRVRALEGGTQGAVAEMGVDLGRRHRRVAEQLLHDAQVGAALEQVRREGVAQDVRRHGLLDADSSRVPAHDPEHALAGDAAAARVEQECGRFLLLAEERPAAGEVATGGVGREAAHRDDALAPALALDAHEAALEIEIARAQAGQLGDAQSATVEQLQRGAVSQPERRGVGVLHDERGLLEREHPRQPLGQPRQRHDRARVHGTGADAAAVAQEGARGREAPPARGRCQPGSLERARERLEIVRGRVVDLDVALAQELLQLRQVAAVGGDGVARCAPLEREVREEVCDCIHAQHLRVPAPVPSRPVSTHAGGSRTGAVDAVIWLDGEPLSIRVSPGVHTPSPFTQALIAALPRVDGLTVIDAGCGAGAVTVALLLRGAAHVSAWDIVPAAIEDTLENVSRHADPARVTPHLGSFDCIADVDADLLVTNPPQRPRSVWERLPADARGVGAGGEDGLEQLELILASTRAPRVITSISSLTAPDLAPIARRHGFEHTSLLADIQGAHDPIWRYAGSLEDARIRVWELRR